MMKSIFYFFALLFFTLLPNFVWADTSTEAETLEAYALSDKREEILKTLTPGTELYYFLHTLYYQQTQQLNEANKMLLKWKEISNQSSAFNTMLKRQKILTLESDPNTSYTNLKEILNLNFNHSKPISLSPKIYPSVITKDMINLEERFISLLLNPRINLSELTIQGLYEISKRELVPTQLQSLLDAYPYPDLPNLVDLVIQDLTNYPNSKFGALKVHKIMTLEQLNELKSKKVDIVTHEDFISEYLKRLTPFDPHFAQKPLLYKKYLFDCYTFLKDLNPSLNTLKASYLQEYLRTCLELGKPDFDLFIQYIQLPQYNYYVNLSLLREKHLPVDFVQYRSSLSGLPIPAIQKEDTLLKTYLYKYIQTKQDLAPIAPYFEKSFLDYFEAETKIMTGLAEPEAFLTKLLPSDIEKIRSTIEIQFTPENSKSYSQEETVKLFLQIKNCSEIEIQTYQINILDYYRNENKDVNPNISLEGYIPNYTEKIKFSQPSYIKHDETIELTQLKNPGVYIVEVSGSGIKARAFIQKGQIFPVIYSSNDGQEFHLFDDQQRLITNYTAFIDKHQLEPDSNGMIKIPFTSHKTAQNKNIIFYTNGIAYLYHFTHNTEDYRLSQVVLNHKESLIPGQNTTLFSKLILKKNDKPIEIQELQELTADIRISDSQGKVLATQNFLLQTTSDFQNLSFYIPEKAANLVVTFTGKVKKTTSSTPETINTAMQIKLAGSDSNREIQELYLRKQGNIYQMECLNKAGIPQPNVSVYVKFYTDYFRAPIALTLQTNEKGIIQLNSLEKITSLQVNIIDGPSQTWRLSSEYTSRPDSMTCLVNDQILLPFYSKSSDLSQEILFLKKDTSNQRFITNKTAALKKSSSFITIPTDEEGFYHLIFKNEGITIPIYIVNGKKQNHYIITDHTIFDETTYLPQQIFVKPLQKTDTSISGLIQNFEKDTKLFCLSTRYYSQFSDSILKDQLDVFLWPNQLFSYTKKENSYFISSYLSAEAQYIAQRKSILKFPGNNLPPPSTLLNPWDIGLTDFLEMSDRYKSLYGGGAMRPASESKALKSSIRSEEERDSYRQSTEASPDLSFFKNALVEEIKLQEDGKFEISLIGKESFSYLQLIAISPYGAISRKIPLPTTKQELLDIRQSKDKSDHQDQLPAFVLTSVLGTEPAAYTLTNEKRFIQIDTLAKLQSSLNTVIKDKTFNQFKFLTKWSTLTEAEKLNRYKEYACHELHFFLFQKDKVFFEKHIKPFLQNKQDKSIIDKYILGGDLSMYTDINRFNRLNTFEKILLIKRIPTLKSNFERQLREYLEKSKPNNQNEIEIMESILNGEASRIEQKSLALQANEVYEDLDGAITEENSLMELKEELSSEKDSLKELRHKKANITGGAAKVHSFHPVLEDTKEYAEANYYHLVKTEERPSLIPYNRFWYDYLTNEKETFISEHILNFTNIHEALLALALIDLPETNTTSSQKIEVNLVTFTSKTPMIILLKSFRKGVVNTNTISLQQHYFYYKNEKKEIIDLQKEPLYINQRYHCLTIATNTSSQARDLYLNNLIPEGALPLDQTSKTMMSSIHIEPFTSYVTEVTFFFPLGGKFSHLPAKVVDAENIYTNEKPYLMNVLSENAGPNKDSWEYLVKEGDAKKILAYIKAHNLYKINLSNIYYLLKDKNFFESLITELESRVTFDYTVWSYSFYHKDLKRLAAFLPNTTLIYDCGSYFHSKILPIDPIQQKRYEHTEFFPLVKSRAHNIQNLNAFENEQAREKYSSFIQILLYKPTLNSSDYLNLTIFMLNQLRIEQAIHYFKKIAVPETNEKLQYDYVKAYLSLYQSDTKTAANIAQQYKDLEIPHWKDKFQELQIQLKEIETHEIDEKARGNTYSASALLNQETTITTQKKGSAIEVSCRNIKTIQVNYYLMDIEVLFSNSPFEAKENSLQFLTQPNVTETITLKNEKEDTFTLSIPDSIKNKNIVIQLSGNGKVAVTSYYPNQMNIILSENHGELRVLDIQNQKPIPATYVKVYGNNKNTGKVELVKDGYTDLRGIFNYVDVSNKSINQYKNLAILILNDQKGASILYTIPPVQ